MKRNIMFTAALALTMAGCTKAQPDVDVKVIDKTAHDGYVAAINSNNTETLLADLTDNIVYQAPGAPEIVGKEAVREWIKGYFEAYQTKWAKTSLGFTVSGDWAFERYTYNATDTDKKTGAVTTDIGKGINIFHHDADGKWRVAVDGWSSDKPAQLQSLT